MQHNIYTAHCLSIKRSKEVARAAPQMGAGVHIFNGMSNITDAMRPAPISYLFGKTVTIPSGYCVHIVIAQIAASSLHIVPKAAKVGQRIFVQPFRQHFTDFPAPWQAYARNTDTRIVKPSTDWGGRIALVSKLRFIGKKALKCISKIRMISRIMRFIYCINQDADRLFI